MGIDRRMAIGIILATTAITAAVAAPLAGSDRVMSDLRLHDAAAKDDTATIRTLIAAGAKVDARDEAERTPLLVATQVNAVRAAEALIAAGADVNAKDRIEDSPYLYAGARGHLGILTMTLAAGADLKSVNRYGGTALIPAAERGHVDTVRALIAAGIDVDHVNRLGWTALIEAIILGDGGPSHQRIVELLIEAGADVNLADGDGVTPLYHAHSRGFAAMERALARAGAR